MLTLYNMLSNHPEAWTSHQGAVTPSRSIMVTRMLIIKDLSTTRVPQVTQNKTLLHPAPLILGRNVRTPTRWWRSLATPPWTCWTVTVSCRCRPTTLPSLGYHDTMDTKHLPISSHQSRGKDTAALGTSEQTFLRTRMTLPFL